VCGTLFMPLYLTAMGWSWIRTGDRAARNIFERAAGLADGGYTDVPVHPLRSLFERRVSGRGRARAELRSGCDDARRGAGAGA
jgi:hypothetical protein